MKDFFSLNRFLLLLKNHLLENRKKYTLFSVSVFAIGFLIVILFFIVGGGDYNCHCTTPDGAKTYINRNNSWRDLQAVLYWVGLFVFGAMFALASYVNFGNQGEAIFYMNKPASVFEKWLVETFVRIVLFFVVYTGIFYIIFVPTTFLYNAMEYWSYKNHYALNPYNPILSYQDYCSGGIKPVFEASQIFNFATFGEQKDALMIYSLLISSYVSGIAFFMYGSVLFNKFSFFKTFLLGFGIFMVYVLYGLVVGPSSNLFITKGWHHRPFSDNAYNTDNTDLFVEMDPQYISNIFLVLMVFVPISLLTISYFKLKEKEI